ncbi:MAG: DUF86 domain-containing protein [Holophagales bacterium]|jgi:uncharacterized protein with HEPN domain|nr:DUF86 domain-containing protein [Holophagales bacterium]
MKTSDRTILKKIHAEVLEIDLIIKGCDLNSFIANTTIKKAVCMTLINIGELIKHLSPELTKTNNHIPWKNISGLRDVAAHSYSALRMEDIYTDAIENMPKFRKQIETVLNKSKSTL